MLHPSLPLPFWKPRSWWFCGVDCLEWGSGWGEPEGRRCPRASPGAPSGRLRLRLWACLLPLRPFPTTAGPAAASVLHCGGGHSRALGTRESLPGLGPGGLELGALGPSGSPRLQAPCVTLTWTLGALCRLLQDASRQASPPPPPGPPRQPSCGAVIAELLCIIHRGRWALEPLCVGRGAERMGGFFARRLGRLGLASSVVPAAPPSGMGDGVWRHPERCVAGDTSRVGSVSPGVVCCGSAPPPLVALCACWFLL